MPITLLPDDGPIHNPRGRICCYINTFSNGLQKNTKLNFTRYGNRDVPVLDKAVNLV